MYKRQALVNNAQREHQEFMVGVLAVAQENGQVIQALGQDGTAVFPADDAFTPLWRQLAGQRAVLTFSSHAAADVTAQAQWQTTHGAWALTLQTPAGRVDTRLRLPGDVYKRQCRCRAPAAAAARCARPSAPALGS